MHTDGKMAMLRVGTSVIWAAVTCKAFYIPIETVRGILPAGRDLAFTNVQQRTRSQQRQHVCHERDDGIRRQLRQQRVMRMSIDDASGSEDKIIVDGADGTLSNAERPGEDEAETGNKVQRGDQSRGGKRPKTPEEEAYLKWMNAAPTIYKRNLNAESIASVGYDGAFEPIDAPGRLEQTENPVVVGEDGKEAILLRVVLVGGGDAEGTFLKRLSDQAVGKLVSGLYVLWDPRVCPMSEKFAEVPFLNVHELGSKNTKDPVKIAQHASFLCAHMVIVVSEQPNTGPDFPARVKAAALEEGITFVGPAVAAEVVDGNMETFTKLVDGTRAAVAASMED